MIYRSIDCFYSGTRVFFTASQTYGTCTMIISRWIIQYIIDAVGAQVFYAIRKRTCRIRFEISLYDISVRSKFVCTWSNITFILQTVQEDF
jgi:hypothetical protein